MDFKEFPKIPRLSRDCVITEKIDGTNASIYIGEAGEFLVGSRTRWITPDTDNYGFARWAMENKEELLKLGLGHHFGEWWGQGIQRGYGLKEKRLSLFNVGRWANAVPTSLVSLVPTLYTGPFGSDIVDNVVNTLRVEGSKAAPGFMKPEGIVLYHSAARSLFKKTIEKDEKPKGSNE